MKDLLAQLIVVLTPVILALAGLVALRVERLLKEKARVEIDANRREAIATGLRNAALLLLSKAANGGAVMVGGQVIDAVKLSAAQKVRFMADRVSERYAGSAEHFGLSYVDLSEMAEIELKDLSLRQ